MKINRIFPSAAAAVALLCTACETVDADGNTVDNTGKYMALFGSAMVTGMAADTIGTEAALDVFGATVVDITSEDGVRTGAALNESLARNSSTSPGPRTTSSIQSASTTGSTPGPKNYVYDEDYTFSCPMSGGATVPIKTNSAACYAAMKAYAKAGGCNEAQNLDKARESYTSACAHEMYN